MLSGAKPAASMVRAVAQEKEFMPCPTSNSTPRARDFWTALRAVPSCRTGAEAVGQDVAGTQQVEGFAVGRRRLVDRAHQGQAALVGGVERQMRRDKARGAARISADPDLDADDDLGIVAGDLSDLSHGQPAHVLGLVHRDCA